MLPNQNDKPNKRKTRDSENKGSGPRAVGGTRGIRMARPASSENHHAEGREPGGRAPSSDVAQGPEGQSELELWRWPTAFGS